jgi:hypothetical protein
VLQQVKVTAVQGIIDGHHRASGLCRQEQGLGPASFGGIAADDRVHGDIRRINLPPMEHEDVHAMVYDIMSDPAKMYEENLNATSASPPNLALSRQRVRAAARGGGVPEFR